MSKGKLRRIHIHWTGGTHRTNAIEREAYHILIEGDGREVLGVHRPEANIDLSDGKPYAAHTGGANTGAIGVALCAMHGAVERPFQPGHTPITAAQVTALATTVATLCESYDIPVRPNTVLTHAEVQKTLGVRQRNKWDITWLPHMDGPGDPHAVGDFLRGLIADQLRDEPTGFAPDDAVHLYDDTTLQLAMDLFANNPPEA